MRKKTNSLARWRIRHGLTQRAAAGRIGATSAAWSDIEAGRRRPSLSLAIGIEVVTDGLVQIETWGHDARPILVLVRRRRAAESNGGGS